MDYMAGCIERQGSDEHSKAAKDERDLWIKKMFINQCQFAPARIGLDCIFSP
jgi:hypothetical protein